MSNDYLKQAKDFLTHTNTIFKCEFLRNDYYFTGDQSKRDIYLITLSRGNRQFSFEFGQSIANSIKFEDKLSKNRYTSDGKSAGPHTLRYLYPEKFPKNKNDERFNDFKIIKGIEPTEYDVLACLTKYDVGSLEDFISEYGYTENYVKDHNGKMVFFDVKELYNKVVNEFNNVCMLWSDNEIEILQEIQ